MLSVKLSVKQDNEIESNLQTILASSEHFEKLVLIHWEDVLVIVKYGQNYLRSFLKVIHFMTTHFKKHNEVILDIINKIKNAIKKLQVKAAENKLLSRSLSQFVPFLKKYAEEFSYRVKVMLSKNKTLAAFELRNVKTIAPLVPEDKKKDSEESEGKAKSKKKLKEKPKKKKRQITQVDDIENFEDDEEAEQPEPIQEVDSEELAPSSSRTRAIPNAKPSFVVEAEEANSRRSSPRQSQAKPPSQKKSSPARLTPPKATQKKTSQPGMSQKKQISPPKVSQRQEIPISLDSEDEDDIRPAKTKLSKQKRQVPIPPSVHEDSDSRPLRQQSSSERDEEEEEFDRQHGFEDEARDGPEESQSTEEEPADGEDLNGSEEEEEEDFDDNGSDLENFIVPDNVEPEVTRTPKKKVVPQTKPKQGY